MTQTGAPWACHLSAVSPIGEAYQRIPYATLQERTRVLFNLRTNGWTGIVLHDYECPQPPADDHEHCPLHGCVEYVCCEPAKP